MTSVAALLLTSRLFLSPLASPTETPPTVIDCLDGAYDLGPNAAALIFQCDDDAQTSGHGQMAICRRETLMTRGYCTGQNHPISCAWQVQDQNWLCEESGTYPFSAWIKRTDQTNVDYKFKSSFNDGELSGTPIDLPEAN